MRLDPVPTPRSTVPRSTVPRSTVPRSAVTRSAHPLFRRARLNLIAPFGAALALAGLLTSCSPAVRVAPAPASADPKCAAMMVALPDVLDGQQLRETSSQGTAVWGDPAKIVLRCGVTPPGPTTDACATVNGVDWVIRQAGQEAGAGEGTADNGNEADTPGGSSSYADPELYTVITYGRTPATELMFSQREVSSSNVLAQLTAAASQIPQQRRCLGPADLSTP